MRAKRSIRLKVAPLPPSCCPGAAATTAEPCKQAAQMQDVRKEGEDCGVAAATQMQAALGCQGEWLQAGNERRRQYWQGAGEHSRGRGLSTGRKCGFMVPRGATHVAAAPWLMGSHTLLLAGHMAAARNTCPSARRADGQGSRPNPSAPRSTPRPCRRPSTHSTGTLKPLGEGGGTWPCGGPPNGRDRSGRPLFPKT